MSSSVIEVLALEALALRGRGDNAAAFRALERALVLAEPAGYIRMFVDEGESAQSLISDFRLEIVKRTRDDSSQRLCAYCDKLLAAFPAPTRAARPSIVEPLSDREIEVLRLIAIGASNQEIAEKLVVAVNTVKRHVSHIFDKLQVTNRTQAVAKARDLQLI